VELQKNKELKGCKFSDEEVKECASKMLLHMRKYDPKRAEGYKMVLLLCLKIFESQEEDKTKLITRIIKTVANLP